MRQLLRTLAATAVAVVAGTAGTASAADPACTTTTPFAQFGDNGGYALLISGTMEKGINGFQVTGSPSIVNPNEKYYLHAKSDSKALQLSSGDSATFHAGCLPRVNPSLRFVARVANGAAGTLDVKVQYQDLSGVVHSVDLGTLDASGYGDWTPSPVLTFLNDNAKLDTQAQGNVFFTFTPSGNAKWQLDDLYIDPYRVG